MSEIRDTDIAVIGMAGRFPGARDVATFWRNICGGVESIATFSQQELLDAGVGPDLAGHPEYVPAGGILDDVEHFDAAFFGFSPREAAVLDPQHRLFLEIAWEALEHAGYAAPTYPGAISVYAGAGMNSYLLEHLYPNRAELAATSDLFQVQLGNDKDHLATKVSFKLNLKGPSMAVQTACSTSLVAVHLACQNLLNGESDLALAGGVAVQLPQKSGYLYREGMILSPDGHCRAFDSRARGTVGGSGAGVVVLKRLAHALADGDTVYAVVRGSAINNDGAVKIGYTAPSTEGQRAVIAEALAVADVDPDTITLVEAHGTGTPLGDPIEVAALTQAFRTGGGRRGYCALGSVKTNVGHLDVAAGVCGLIKAVLALHHGILPPSLHFEQPNPSIDFASSPFYVNTTATPWNTGSMPRRAGVSSFGIGGTNAHVILEQAPPPEPAASAPPEQLLVLSAKTATALDTATRNLTAYLREHPEVRLADAAYTLQVGRVAMPYRRVLVCQSRADLLARWGSDQPLPVAHAPDTGAPEVVFLFPGQGAQHSRMAASLYADQPIFRRELDHCAELLLPHLGQDIRTLIFEQPETESTKDTKGTNGLGRENQEPRTKNQEPDTDNSKLNTQNSKLRETRFAQPALFSVEYALARLWMHWGVRPAAMIGHSIGEYVAACLAGVLSLEEALLVVAERGRLMQQQPPGAMLSVALPEQALRPLLAGGLSLAAVNGPAQSVVAGPHGAIAALAEQLDRQGVSTRNLHTSHAFHSTMMQPALEPFARLMQRVRLRPPQIPFFSNSSGTWITPDQATDPQYWAQHLTATVRFGDGLALLLGSPGQILLEVGPGRTLTALAMHHPARAPEQLVLASLPHPRDQQPDRSCLLGALGQLWLAGVPIDWEQHSDPATRRRAALPAYPFERQRYWIAPRREAAPASAPATEAKRPDIAEWFSMPSWKLTPPPEPVAATPARWLVFAGPHGLGQALAQRLRAAGHQVVVVLRGQRFERLDAQTYQLDPLCGGDYQRLLDLVASGGPPQHIAHLWHCGPPAEGFDPAVQQQCFAGMLLLAQALGNRLLMEELELVTVASGLADVSGDEPLSPDHALLLGPCKVLAQEYPRKRSRCIDVVVPQDDPAALAQLAGQLLAELLDPPGEPLVAYRGRRRWVQIYEPVALRPPITPAVRLRQQGTYLITGGLGGIGLTLAQYLARTVQARLVLAGRSALPARKTWDAWRATHPQDDATSQKIALLQQLEHEGALLEIATADVSDSVAMRALVARARERFGRIDGIIHAAGVPGESSIQRKTLPEAAQVLAAKVAGTLVLDQLIREDPPDFLVLCSSLRAVIGGAGHADYCAANAFLDAYANASARRSQATRVIAIGWDGWRDVGMAVEAVRRRGLGPESFSTSMTPAEGVAVFERALARGLPHLLVSTIPLQSQIEREQQLPSFSNTPAPAARPAAHPRPNLSTPYVPPASESERILVAIWQEAFGIEQVGIHDNFFELGGDSISGILTTAKAHERGLRLNAGLVFEHQTIAALALVAGAAAPPAAQQGLVGGPVALTPIQHWFFEQQQPATNHFNQAVLLALPRDTAPAHLEAALQQVLLQHDALRLRFVLVPDGWQQSHALPDPGAVLVCVDLAPVAPEQQPAAMEAEATVLQTSLDITNGPVLRAALFQLGHGRDDRLLLVAHHLVIDGFSWRILLADLHTALQQIARGEPVRLPPKTTSYQQWSARLAQAARAESARTELDYWLDPARSQAAPLPRDGSGGDNTLASAQSVRAELSAQETEQLLHNAPKAYHMQIHDLLVAALAGVLSGWSGSPAVLIDIEAQGRDLALDGVDLSRTVGWCTAIYPALLDLTAAAGPAALAAVVKRQLRAIPGGGLRYSALRYLCDDPLIRERLAAAPRAEVVFLHLGQTDAEPVGAGLFAPVDGPTGPSRSPLERRPYLLEVSSAISSGRLWVEWHYSRHAHSQATVERLAQTMLATLRGLSGSAEAQPPQARSAADFPLAGIDDQKLAKIAALLGQGNKRKRT